jgi:hypothetical protein
MKHPSRARGVLALVAAYVIALQGLLLPLTVAAADSPGASLCSGTTNRSPIGHDDGGPCACGAQCCVQAFMSPPPVSAVRNETIFVAISFAPLLADAVRAPVSSPLLPRAPPFA